MLPLHLASVHQWQIETWETYIWMKQKRIALLVLPGKGGWHGIMSSRRSHPEGLVKSLMLFKEQSVVTSWMFFWLIGGEIIGGASIINPLGSKWSGFTCLCTVNSLTWWGFQYQQNISKDMLLDVIWHVSEFTYSP